ncbi:type II secretion system protein GspN [Desulfosarcina ovata]|uniref:Type II secretion system protein GspN n=1 Tax=Desulfosarcina ovata subsp. ovata TaxID=2752305 RepID=A0A5K8A533_9BACT|nr:type II secretion system protein GspN [Desulfosarcina ovata]BBO87464.1 hypothetical protein DSCOOX_06440 [Desulfosarcina ovata subsp. ovata]
MLSMKAIFGYLAYALGAVVLFVYLLFPDQTVTAYLQSRLASVDPALKITAADIRPTLPPGLKMNAADIDKAGHRVVHIDKARITPELRSLLQPDKQLRFAASLADGSIIGRTTITDRTSSGVQKIDADLDRIQLEKIDAVKQIESFSLVGELRGHVTYDGAREPDGMTNGRLTVARLRINLKTPFFGIADLLMEKTEAEFSMNRNNLRLSALTFEGPMAEGRISGIIEVRHPLSSSRLNLTGTAKPMPELLARLQESLAPDLINTRTLGTRGISFRIRGTIDNPDLSMR